MKIEYWNENNLDERHKHWKCHLTQSLVDLSLDLHNTNDKKYSKRHQVPQMYHNQRLIMMHYRSKYTHYRFC